MIYFLMPTEGGPVKIGYATDVERRRSELEKLFGKPLAVLHTMEGDRATEHQIHTRFASLRIGHTEQFRPGPELMTFIRRPLLSDPDHETTEAMTPSTRAVRLELDPATHRLLRIAAAELNVSMAALVRMIVEDHLASKATQGGPE